MFKIIFGFYVGNIGYDKLCFLWSWIIVIELILVYVDKFIFILVYKSGNF